MFGFDCSSGCGKADTPAESIIKVSYGMRQELQEQARVVDEAELRRREAAAAAAREAERQADAEWLSAEDFELRRRKEADEAARREAEVAAVVAAAARQQQEKKQRRLAVEAQAELRKAAVGSFLKDYGFTDVSSAKRNLVRSTYPLHKAAKLGCGALVAMLLQEGAKPAQRDSWGQTAAEVAQQYNKGNSHAVVLRELQSFSSKTESPHKTKAALDSSSFVRSARMAGA